MLSKRYTGVFEKVNRHRSTTFLISRYGLDQCGCETSDFFFFFSSSTILSFLSSFASPASSNDHRLPLCPSQFLQFNSIHFTPAAGKSPPANPDSACIQSALQQPGRAKSPIANSSTLTLAPRTLQQLGIVIFHHPGDHPMTILPALTKKPAIQINETNERATQHHDDRPGSYQAIGSLSTY